MLVLALSLLIGIAGHAAWSVPPTAVNGSPVIKYTNPAPTVTTAAVSNITDTTATCGGNVASEGGSAVTARGVCWSTSANPTTADNLTSDGTGAGSFTSSITGLTAGTTYHVRAYATNSGGTSYGTDELFTTTPPTLTIVVVGNVGSDGVDNVGGTPIPGTIDCPAIRCGADFNRNDAVTLNVTVDAASSFQGWGGDCATFGTALFGVIVMDGDKTCICAFGTALFGKGDIDGDGDRDVLDVRLCLQVARGIIPGTSDQRVAADVDDDGDVDETDARILAEFVIR